MITEICDRLHFPQEATRTFGDCLTCILAEERTSAWLSQARELYFSDTPEAHTELLRRVSEETGIHRYTVDMVFLLFCIPWLREAYRNAGLPEELLWETMSDLRSKLMECKAVHDLWGNFVAYWYRGFFTLQRFRLGRLEFEHKPYPGEDYRGIVRRGDQVVNCHIPSGSPLTTQSVLESLGRAYDFYRDELRDGKLVVICHSWLLYPPHYGVFPEDSNLRKFYDLFQVTHWEPDEKNSDFWRIFNRFYDESWKNAPADTALRRNFLRYFEQSGTMGNGYGVLLFDGNTVLTGP